MRFLTHVLLPLLLIFSNHSSGVAASVKRDVNLEVKTDCSQRINCLSRYENNSEFECAEPISQLKVGDEVLALSEWKAKGSKTKTDQRLSYEKVTDVFSSHKEQNLIHLTLDNGETLTATEGHPFKTTEGWRDAVMLKKGGKLLLKGGDDAADDSDIAATIIDIRTEIKFLPVFNLEVANAHTFFVGEGGELVHNGFCSFPKAPRGKGSAPPDMRDKKRAFDRDQVDDALKKNDGKCFGCGDKLDLKDAKGHHIDRHADGGPTTPNNLAPLCLTCHKNVHSP
jgi:Pretoxin HINT domain/HNH endonuclease